MLAKHAEPTSRCPPYLGKTLSYTIRLESLLRNRRTQSTMVPLGLTAASLQSLFISAPCLLDSKLKRTSSETTSSEPSLSLDVKCTFLCSEFVTMLDFLHRLPIQGAQKPIRRFHNDRVLLVFFQNPTSNNFSLESIPIFISINSVALIYFLWLLKL